jgi:hypothetical protein
MVTGLGKPHPYGSFNHAISALDVIFGAWLVKTQIF